MKFKLTIGISILTISASAWALKLGPSTGGGGFAVFCPATPISVASTELLDIYEGRRELRYEMAQATGDIRNDYFDGVDRTYTIQGHANLAEKLRSKIQANLTTFMQSAKFVDTAADLPSAADLGEAARVPSQCEIRQIAYFDDRSSTIFILRSAWDQLDSVNQAALVHHEVWFRDFRAAGETTSENARRMVAQIYALRGPLKLDEGLPSAPPSFSAVPTPGTNVAAISSFYGVNFTASGITRLQFTQVHTMPQLSKTWADFSLMVWDFRLESGSCVLRTVGVDAQYEAPLNGVAVKGYSLKLKLQTGKPLVLTVLRNGIAIGEGHVGGGSNCSESLH